MDLLEYQGKQLFSKHGVPVPEGRHATAVADAVDAAEQLGYPVVIKAQVLIGGRGKAGGIKLATDRESGRGTRRRDPRDGHPRLHRPRGLGREGAEIDEEYYAAIVFDRSAKQPMAMLSRMGGMDVRRSPRRTPKPCAWRMWTRCSASRTSTGGGLHTRRASPLT